MPTKNNENQSTNQSPRPSHNGYGDVIKHSATPGRPVTPNTGIKTDGGSSGNSGAGESNKSSGDKE